MEADPTKKEIAERNRKREERIRKEQSRKFWSLSPMEMVKETLDFLYAWRKTRNWRAILAIVPPLILLGTLGGFVLAGRLRSRESLLKWYEEKANQAIGLNADGSPVLDSNGEQKERTPADDARAELLFKRILQLGGNSQQASFYVALRNAQFGKPGVARTMMESIAPKNAPGFPYAHAWLAEDMLRRSTGGEPISPQELMHHLGNAIERSEARLPANLYSVYAQLLEQTQRFDDAAKVLTRASDFAPELSVEAVLVYLRHGLNNQALTMSDQVVSNMRARLQKPTSTDKDREICSISIARAYQLTNRADESIAFSEKALVDFPKSADLRRVLSDSYRLKFRSSLGNANGKGQVELNFLNLAIAADPTNIAIQSDLNILGQLGISNGADNRARLSSLIAKQGASFAARMLLAEAAIRANDVPASIVHYEVILAELPNMTLALNNLSMLNTKLSPPDIDKARELIQKAIEFSPQVAEFLDSKGDIELVADNKPAAVEAYLSALEKSPERLETRKKLIDLYTSLNDTEAANKQSELFKVVEARLKAIQEQLQGNAQQNSAPQNSAPPNNANSVPPTIPQPTPTIEPNAKETAGTSNEKEPVNK